MAEIVDREMMSVNGGACNMGDMEANRINRIVSSIGSFQHNIPTANVNKEVNALASFQDARAMLDIDKEVNALSFGQHNRAVNDVSREADFFSNILKGQVRKKRR